MNTDQQTCTGKQEEVDGCPTYKCECFNILGIGEVQQLAGEMPSFTSIIALDFASPCNGMMEKFTFFNEHSQKGDAYLLILEPTNIPKRNQKNPQPSRFARKFKVRAKLNIKRGPVGEQTIHIGKEIKSGDVLGVSIQGKARGSHFFISSKSCESTNENGCSMLASLKGKKAVVGKSYGTKYYKDDNKFRILSMNAQITCKE